MPGKSSYNTAKGNDEEYTVNQSGPGDGVGCGVTKGHPDVGFTMKPGKCVSF